MCVCKCVFVCVNVPNGGEDEGGWENLCVYDMPLYLSVTLLNECEFACRQLWQLCIRCIHSVYLVTSSPLQDPILEAVKPTRGPKAGGTLITISGKFLDTGSKDDVQVAVGGVDCFV